MKTFINTLLAIFRKDFYRSENTITIISTYMILAAVLLLGFNHISEAFQNYNWWIENSQENQSKESKSEEYRFNSDTKPLPLQELSKNRRSASQSNSKSVGSIKVSTLQKILRARGCKVSQIDGIFGPQTLSAIRQYQKTNKRFIFKKSDINGAINYLKRNPGSCYTSRSTSISSLNKTTYGCTERGRDSIKLNFLNSKLTSIILRGRKLTTANKGRQKLAENLYVDSSIRYSNTGINVNFVYYQSPIDELSYRHESLEIRNNSSKPKFKIIHRDYNVVDGRKNSSSRGLIKRLNM